MMMLACGHTPPPQSNPLDVDRWCSVCSAWVAVVIPPAPSEVADLIEEAASFLRHPVAAVEQRDAPLAVDQGGAIGRCVCCGRWTAGPSAWCAACDAADGGYDQ